MHALVLLSLVCSTACAEPGVISDANLRYSMLSLQQLDAAMAAMDGDASVEWITSFGASAQATFTPNGNFEELRAHQYRISVAGSENADPDVIACTATSCTFDFVSSNTTGFRVEVQGGISRSGNSLMFDVTSKSFQYEANETYEGTTSGTLNTRAGVVDGSVHVVVRQHIDLGYSGRASSDVTLNYTGVTLDAAGCITDGSISARNSYDASGGPDGSWGASFDIEGSQVVSPSCPQ